VPFRILSLIRRADGWDRDRFFEHWRTVHAPLVARIPGLQSYRVSRLGPDLSGAEAPWDGMAELFFATREDYFRARQTREYADANADGSFIGPRQQVFVDDCWEIV
jgi:uncharacterized protein (TIGR02118 family)